MGSVNCKNCQPQLCEREINIKLRKHKPQATKRKLMSALSDEEDHESTSETPEAPPIAGRFSLELDELIVDSAKLKTIYANLDQASYKK